MDGGKDAVEQISADRNPGKLEGNGAGVADDPRAGFDQSCLEAGQRPVGYLLGQISALQEDTGIVGQCVKLKADLVLRHALAGEARPVDCLLSLFDVLLSGATLIVEPDDPVCLHWHIGNDKTNPREQFTRMPFHLGDDTTGFVPGRSLILEVAAGASHMVGRTAHRALEQMRNLALKNTIGAEPDGIEIALRFEHLVEVWDGEGGGTSEEPH